MHESTDFSRKFGFFKILFLFIDDPLTEPAHFHENVSTFGSLCCSPSPYFNICVPSLLLQAGKTGRKFLSLELFIG